MLIVSSPRVIIKVPGGLMHTLGASSDDCVLADEISYWGCDFKILCRRKHFVSFV